MKRVHAITATVATTTLLLGVAGCSAEQPTPSSGDGPSGTLTMMANVSAETGWLKVIEMFEEKYPDVDVQEEFVVNGSAETAAALVAQLQGGGGPDIFPSFAGTIGPMSVGALAPAGMVRDLSDRPWAADLPDFVTAGSTAGGILGTQVIGITQGVMIYNGDTLEEMGLETPTTFDEVLAYCEDVRKQDPDLIPLAFGAKTSGLVIHDGMGMALTEVGAEWTHAEGETFANSGWSEGLDKWVQLKDAECFSPGVAGDDLPAVYQQVPSGQAVGSLGSTSAFGAIQLAAPDVNWVFTPIPYDSEEDTQLSAPRLNNAIAINANAENEEAALAFSDFLGTPEVLNAYAEANAYSDLPLTAFLSGDGWPDQYATLREVYDRGYTFDPSPNFPTPATTQALSEGIVGILTGQLNVDQVVSNLDASWGKK